MTTATATPAQLIESQRVAQARIRSLVLRDFLRLAPLWHGDAQTFARLVQASIPLARVYFGMSAAAAVSFYQAFRLAEGAAGEATPRLATLSVEALVKSMYVTGQVMTKNALAAGRTAQEARQVGLMRVGGALARHVLTGGRTTILDSVQADPHAHGWARVTDGDPCYFCLTLASRGAVYKSEQTAGFEAHDHCGCTAIPVFDGTVIPNLQRWRDIYNGAQDAGESSGLLQGGENSSDARLHAVRVYLADHPITV